MTIISGKVSSAPTDCNVFLLIQEIFEEHGNTVNSDIEMQYRNINVQNSIYENELAQWKTDGDALAKASAGTNKTSLSTFGWFAIVAGICLAAATVLSGGLLLPVTLGLAALILGIHAGTRGIATGVSGDGYGSDNWGFTKTTNTVDQGTYQTASQACQTDQANVTKTQNSMNQALQQYISPDQDMKTQDANMIQGALKWMSSLVWTQPAA